MLIGIDWLIRSQDLKDHFQTETNRKWENQLINGHSSMIRNTFKMNLIIPISLNGQKKAI